MIGDTVSIAPSILAADFLHLARSIDTVEKGGADRLHIDVMDGRFVPNISIGLPVLRAIRSATGLQLETHLMIVEPERYVDAFAEAGADLITVHAEVSPHLYGTLQHIHGLGKRAGVAVNPGTSLSALSEVLHLADSVLIMTVNPGFGGQQFIGSTLPKLAELRRELARRQLITEIAVDGGIDPETARQAAAAGARTFVAGTSVFGSAASPGEAIQILRRAATDAIASVRQ